MFIDLALEMREVDVTTSQQGLQLEKSFEILQSVTCKMFHFKTDALFPTFLTSQMLRTKLCFIYQTAKKMY